MLGVKSLDSKMSRTYHYPVMWEQALEGLQIEKKRCLVDCTAGLAGHAQKALSLAKDIFYVGIDRDSDSLLEAYLELKPFEGRFVLLQESFSNLDLVCQEMRLDKVDAFFFDLGLSSYQLADSGRGFSFLKEGSLDMRFDQSDFVTAFDLVNNLSERELVEIFKKFGQERYSRGIAQALVKRRRERPILTTLELARIAASSIPAKARFGRIHPATRIFQALRIAVNRELESLEAALPKAIDLLDVGGRLGVISFHSLEDRIVKHTFRKFASQNALKIITKKPLRPSEVEKQINPPSRSAKLRIAEKIG